MHGVLKKLSPIMKSRSLAYYNGVLTDGEKEMQLVGFTVTVIPIISCSFRCFLCSISHVLQFHTSIE